MKTRFVVASVLVCALMLGLSASVRALGAHRPDRPSATAVAGTPLTVNINLGWAGDVPTIDPAMATDGNSVAVDEQLFIGLVDLDDETSEPRPELATSWTISPDTTVFTFTLRSDVYWSDGQKVTAEDVRYGILRTLAPATASQYAYVLAFVIKNAAGYNDGTITDPNLVGVEVLGDTHLRITTNQPASFLPSILGLWVARPMPKWAIDTWGSAWTDPDHIVTNGPYRLKEWAHGDRIVLEKNPTYYDAANVQIKRVQMWMRDPGPAWSMYLNDELDTADVPSGEALDPVLRQQVHIAPVGCTYYYGFTTTQPPFNNLLVRKAFVAATDRYGLIQYGLTSNLFKWPPRPALTFTPPGIFGYVDGAAEGVGIPYDPNQARQYLAQAGYPNGQGLPPVTLHFNTSIGHQKIAEYIRQSWYNTLGVSVTLQSWVWQDYLKEVKTDHLQLWRLGWCLDYPDANNWLRDVIAHGGSANPTGGGVNWENPIYEDLVRQAAAEADPATRKALYKLAEEILTETDAVIIPIYHYTSVVATRPYLQRTYPAWALYDIGTWRLAIATGAVSPEAGGTVISTDGSTTLQFPPGALASSAVITETPAVGMPPGGNLAGIGHAFDVTAVNSETGQPAQLVPGATYGITVHYTDAQRRTVVENTLALYWWDGSSWIKEPSSVVDGVANTVSATPFHLSLWAVLGETHWTYLPSAMRVH